MAANVQPYTLASEEGRVFWFLDTLMFVKATGEQTSGMQRTYLSTCFTRQH